MTLDYGSLCTGYDGIGLGLAMAGLDLRHRFVAETEPSVARVLTAELPGVPNVGDIKSAPWQLAPHCQVWSSGDPCQSISIAGRQQGREDPRFLWPWVRAAYRAARPDVIFFENVANIVSHDGGRTLAERFDHLQRDGYGVRWTVLGACAVGAPHHRHRWFAVAARAITGVERVGGTKAICGAPRSGGRALLPSPRSPSVERGAELNRAGRTGTGGTLTDAVALLPTPKASDGTNGGPNQRDGAGKYYLPGIVNLLPTPMADRSGSNRGGSAGRGDDQPLRPSLDSVAQLLPTPAARDGEGRNEGSREFWERRLARPDRAGKGIAVLGAAINAHLPDDGTWDRYAPAIALWESITGIPAPAPTVPGPNGGVRLNPELPEWMMGLRPGLLTQRLSRNDALRAAGNGVVPHAAAAAWRLLTGQS